MMDQTQLDIDYWMLVFVIANFVLVVSGIVWNFFDRRDRVTKQAVDDVNAKIEAHSKDSHRLHIEIKERVTKLEERPRHDQEIVAIHNRINSVAEGQKNLEGRFSETSQAVSRMHDYLMNKGQ